MRPLACQTDMHKYVYMSTEQRETYLRALERVNLSDLARESGRAYRTLQAYRRGEFQPPVEALKALSDHLHHQAHEFTDAARTLDHFITAMRRHNG